MTILRTIDLAGLSVRVFASPLDVPDHPWASFDDLMDVAGMDEADRPRWLDKLRCELPDMLHRTLDGTVIMAEPMVSGMLLALGTMDRDDAQELLDDWTEAWMELFALELAELPGDRWKQAAREAELRNAVGPRGEAALH